MTEPTRPEEDAVAESPLALKEREASCCCGEIRLVCTGDPIRVSICHCLACQRRTGSAISVQARFRRDQIQHTRGTAKTYIRVGDSGVAITFHFCPTCGSTVFWELPPLPDCIAVAVGAFADPRFPPPTYSVYEARQHEWVDLGRLDATHMD